MVSQTGIDVDDSYRFVRDRGEALTRLPTGGGLWLIAGYPELAEALRDHETFSSAHELTGDPGARPGVMIPSMPLRAVPVEVDPPEHLRYRRLLGGVLTQQRLTAIEPDILRYTHWCLDQHIGTGAMDLLHGLCELVPAMVTLRIIGLPLVGAQVIARAVHARGDARFAEGSAWRLLNRQIERAARRRRGQPREDLISYLVHATADGPPLSDELIAQICFTMVIAGMSTTAKLALGALTYYGVHPEARADARENSEVLKTAIEEFLRYYSPVPFLCRTATRDVTVAGRRISRGDRVAMGFAAANRDARVFDEPDEVRLDRQPNRHLAFGHGVHACVGAMLGRLEARVMVEQVLRRMPDYRIAAGYGGSDADGDAPRRVSWAERLHRGLPVEFSPGPVVGTGLQMRFTAPPEPE
jgi:cytochrome P450